jgi:hypothetical protein
MYFLPDPSEWSASDFMLIFGRHRKFLPVPVVRWFAAQFNNATIRDVLGGIADRIILATQGQARPYHAHIVTDDGQERPCGCQVLEDDIEWLVDLCNGLDPSK